MQKQISVSVRNIVELVLRSGDIDSGYAASRAQEGIRIHQQIQRRRKREAKLAGLCYESEVSLDIDFAHKGLDFRIEGRADGVLTGATVVIEEIKSTMRPVNMLAEHPLHWAQAKMYGYMYCVANAVDNLNLRLTYCNVETEEIAEFERGFSREELYDNFLAVIEGYYAFAQMDNKRLNERLTSAEALTFPYPAYRAGQRELAAAVYKTVMSGRALFAQAPTGTGKTVSVLFPAIKALDEGKIFYLTAKTVTRRVAVEALALMETRGLVMRSVVLTAKEKICFGERKCNPVDCAFAAGHFNRVNAAITDIITNETLIRREQLERYARKHVVCPFEFSLDVTGFCDCVICDYNHVYDPKAQLKRFFGDTASRRGTMIILNDEAHNLVERAREMFSAGLSRGDFGLRGMFRGNNKRLYSLLGRIREWFKKLEGFTLGHVLPEGLIYMLRDFVVQADVWLAENPAHPRHAEFLELYFRVLDFLRTTEVFDERYAVLLDGRGDPTVRLLCLDPSYLLAKTHGKARAAVFFSATLTPLKYFRDVFGGTENDYGIRLPSPFPRGNLCLIVSEVPTDYKNRGNSIPLVAERIHTLVTSKPAGNYLAFFSSYEYMNSVHEYFTMAFPDIETILQAPGMAEDERESFLARFSPTPAAVLTGFVVMGGIFSEGIDLTGERLCGVAVVGVGLPMISVERNILSDYYKDGLGMGFEYAYMYPGMNKVLQAAGRVIRTERDRGAVLLIDSRFTGYAYRRLFPDEWSHFVKANSTGRIEEILEGFWHAHDTSDSSV